MIEFVVNGFIDGWVAGRCGDKQIHVGDVFNVAYKAKRRRYPDEMANPCVRELEKSVKLKVEEISAYGKTLESLAGGYTGGLKLSGDVSDWSMSGMIEWTLTNEDKGV